MFCLLTYNLLSFRLHLDSSGGGAWCPSGTIDNGIQASSSSAVAALSSSSSSSFSSSSSAIPFEFLEIDLGRLVVVTHVLTQGRYAKGRGQEYAEAYTLHYWRPGMDEFKSYRDSMGRAVSRITNFLGLHARRPTSWTVNVSFLPPPPPPPPTFLHSKGERPIYRLWDS
jgi:hypothetical protein